MNIEWYVTGAGGDSYIKVKLAAVGISLTGPGFTWGLSKWKLILDQRRSVTPDRRSGSEVLVKVCMLWPFALLLWMPRDQTLVALLTLLVRVNVHPHTSCPFEAPSDRAVAVEREFIQLSNPTWRKWMEKNMSSLIFIMHTLTGQKFGIIMKITIAIWKVVVPQ